MKVSKGQPRLSTRSPIRSVSLQFRDCQVTVKVKSPVPQGKPQMYR
jgi:hypothetical protein